MGQWGRKRTLNSLIQTRVTGSQDPDKEFHHPNHACLLREPKLITDAFVSAATAMAMSNSTKIGLLVLAIVCVFGVTRNGTWKVQLAAGSIGSICGLIALAIAASYPPSHLGEESPELGWMWGGVLALVFGVLLCIRALVRAMLRRR